MLQYVTITIIGVGELVHYWLLYANFHKITYSRKSSIQKEGMELLYPVVRDFFSHIPTSSLTSGPI